ncbi:immunoglobulin lambda-1 light chain-like [Xyrichtys novacula]|nr:immunoglobulin lambda-1 light chain-like [Xyrichtys novacula]
MLLFPAAALCCVCSVLVVMAAELQQDTLSLTRKVGENVSISCGNTDKCKDRYVYWYQKNGTESFKIVLRIDKTNGAIKKQTYDHPQKEDFTAVNTKTGCELQIQSVKVSHSATYYCICRITQ